MRNLHLKNWLGGYAQWLVHDALTPAVTDITHVMFLFVDHFELCGKEPRLSQWLARYPGLAGRHVDADGAPPKHTWFYALDLMREDELDQLRGLVERGLGEVELHWHHSHDTPDSFERKLYRGLETFQKYGFLLPRGNGKAGCFGFIHGNWSLNNSRGKEFCGVDNEIELLAKAGCYADFTFPALHCRAQPAVVNSLYYASRRQGYAGYRKGRRAETGNAGRGEEFMIFPGPLMINWRDWRFKWHPMIDDGAVGASRTHGDAARIDAWIRAGIHVKGRPEWVFVKVYCHGGQDHQAVLGEETDRMFRHLEKAFNDGKRYRLHYVTAREAYNIAKAAEDGRRGDPDLFRNYLIPGEPNVAPPGAHASKDPSTYMATIPGGCDGG